MYRPCTAEVVSKLLSGGGTESALMDDEPIRLATRGSDLALAQANAIASTLERHRRDVELVEIQTTGDELPEELVQRLGTTGAFVRSLDQAVLDGEVDAAVHSMKDVPTDQPAELVFAAIPPRAPAGDVLVSPDDLSLEELPEGAVVGTGSLRRRAQLLRTRSDLTVEPIRGNVDTRLAKLFAPSVAEGEDVDAPDEIIEQAVDLDVDIEYDAIVLAEAGLVRSGFAVEVPNTELSGFVPAPGQGAIAVSSLDGDLAEWMHNVIDDPKTRVETTVERRIMAAIGGGCIAPIGIHAVIQGEQIQTQIQVLERDGSDGIKTTRQLRIDAYLDEAAALADELRKLGAHEIIERARREGPGPQHRD